MLKSWIDLYFYANALSSSLLILLIVVLAYISVVDNLVCPNILLITSIDTPFSNISVANECLAACDEIFGLF